MKENNTDNTTTTRGDIEEDILQQVANEIEEALLLYAPSRWNDKYLDEIEQSVLDNTRLVLAALSLNELQSEGALGTHIANSIEDTRRIIRQGGLRTNS